MRILAPLSIFVLLQSPLPAQSSARSTLLAADGSLSTSVFSTGFKATFAGALDSDGVLVWPGAGVIAGSDVATRFFARQPLLAEAHLSWQPLRIDIAPDSSLAFIVGVAVVERVATPPIAEIHRIGRYLEVWKRVAGDWRLAAFSLVNVLANGETIWNAAIGAEELPALRSTAPGGRFIAADSSLSAVASQSGISQAFLRWAAPDGMTFAPSGELNVGPDRIAAVLAANQAHWEWVPVASGSSDDGVLGWTVDQVLVTLGDKSVRTKDLTLWRRMADGTVKFIARGGNGRP